MDNDRDDQVASAPIPALFGGTAPHSLPPEDDLATDATGEDPGDATRNATGADPATRGAFDTAASNPNVIAPPD
jgi:hypothetical protein